MLEANAHPTGISADADAGDAQASAGMTGAARIGSDRERWDALNEFARQLGLRNKASRRLRFARVPKDGGNFGTPGYAGAVRLDALKRANEPVVSFAGRVIDWHPELSGPTTAQQIAKRRSDYDYMDAEDMARDGY